MGRAMVFIDGSNFYHSLRHETGNTQVDFHKLGVLLAGDDDLRTVYYYNAPLPEQHDKVRYEQQQKFFAAVERTPRVIMRLGRMQDRDGCLVEKGVDVLIAVDMLRHAHHNNYDTAILVSGDGDFVEAIRAVTDLGRIVKNAFFEYGRSNALINVCHDFIKLTPALIDQCRP